MSRYTGIKSLTFAQTPIPLALSVRLSKQCQPLPLGSDRDLFATSVQLASPILTAEVRTRHTSAVENLSLGAAGDLSFIVPAADGSGQRQVTLSGAVLVGTELSYEQSTLATATLRFMAPSADGAADPLEGEELQ